MNAMLSSCLVAVWLLLRWPLLGWLPKARKGLAVAVWLLLGWLPKARKGLRPVATRRSEGTAGPEGAKRWRRHQQPMNRTQPRKKWYHGK